jgi:Alw26I/Eco31I/Esp3I family type II restriction m6 adenine DNA methyltransferase
MNHLNYLREDPTVDIEAFIKKASGQYYTGAAVGHRLAQVVAETYRASNPNAKVISVVDPFGGDARLVEWLIAGWADLAYPPVSWRVSIWDIHDVGFELAKSRLLRIGDKLGAQITTKFEKIDSFKRASLSPGAFDIVLTNPPWELLKPDRREIDGLPPNLRKGYVANMKEYDIWLNENYPRSQPRKKFAGWGTNLSRVGFEASLRLTRQGGIVGSVLPASILADDQSKCLRAYLIKENTLLDVAYYPAEAKLYDKADVESITVVAKAGDGPSDSVSLLTHRLGPNYGETSIFKVDVASLEKVDFVMPVSFGAKAMKVLETIVGRFNSWAHLEEEPVCGLWAGREIDETGILKSLVPSTGEPPLFMKGRMIDRYLINDFPKKGIDLGRKFLPPSIGHARIAWRDVSRPNQKRRIIATLIPSKWVTGNSLGVAYFRDDNETALAALLGVMNSTAFEFQLRAHLATGHVSLSSLRKVSVPPSNILRTEHFLAKQVSKILAGDEENVIKVDAYVAKILYGLTKNEYMTVLELFGKISQREVEQMLRAYCNLEIDLDEVKDGSFGTKARSLSIDLNIQQHEIRL